MLSSLFVVFFFQAEDGIRDLTVTGVQTCALPISPASAPHAAATTSELPPRLAAESTASRKFPAPAKVSSAAASAAGAPSSWGALGGLTCCAASSADCACARITERGSPESAACNACASARHAVRTAGAWQVVRAASAAHSAAAAGCAKKYIATGATRDRASGSSAPGSCEPENGCRRHCARASARAVPAVIPRHCPVQDRYPSCCQRR